MLKDLARSAARKTRLEPQVYAARRTQLALKRRLKRQLPTARRNHRDDAQARAILAAVLRSDSNCVDIGANVGGFLREIVRLAPGGRHVAVEPVSHLAAALRETFPGVDVHAVALADRVGTAAFNVVPSEPALSGFRVGKARNHERQQMTLQVTALDELLPTDYRPDLVKIDVEGAELAVLDGARRTLSTYRPLVLFEHSNRLAPQYGTSPEDIHRFFTECGMRIFDLDGNGPMSEEAFSDVFHRHACFNFLASAG